MSRVGRSELAIDKLAIEDVVLDVVEQEGIEYLLEKHSHPIQDRREVSDHAWRPPFIIQIVGRIASLPGALEVHKRKYETLVKYRDEAQHVKLIIDFPEPRVLKDMLITKLEFKRQSPWVRPNFFYISITLEESQVAHATAVPAPITDRASSSRVDTGVRDFGQQAPLSWGGAFPPGLQVGATAPGPLRSGPQPGDGGILGFFGKAFDMVKDFAGSPLGEIALGAAKSLVNTLLPGSGPAIDILTSLATGDFSMNTLANAAMNLIPGGGFVKDLLSGPAGKVLQFVQGIPGAQDILGRVTSPQTIAGTVMSALSGSLGSQFPALKPIAGLVSSFLNPASGSPTGLADMALQAAQTLGFPASLLPAAKTLLATAGLTSSPRLKPGNSNMELARLWFDHAD